MPRLGELKSTEWYRPKQTHPQAVRPGGAIGVRRARAHPILGCPLFLAWSWLLQLDDALFEAVARQLYLVAKPEFLVEVILMGLHGAI